MRSHLIRALSTVQGVVEACPAEQVRRPRLAGLLVALAAFWLQPDGATAAAESPANGSRPRITSIAIPGDPRLVAVARDVFLVQTAYSPDFASQSGLIDDAIRVPSFSARRLAALTQRIRRDQAVLRRLPWRSWSIDEQIDVRWLYANAERIDRELNVERLYLHRPAAWLEAFANNYVAIVTYAPTRTDALAGIVAKVPAMITEMNMICKPTLADAQIARDMLKGTIAMLKASPASGSDAAIAALSAYQQKLSAEKPGEAFAVIGADNYAWRLKHANLLPWDPAQLRALAVRELATTEAELDVLGHSPDAAAALSPELEAAAINLNQASLLELYDRIQRENRAAIDAAGFVTIPAGVGPIRARVTPDALVPLSGDGGSMNAPPPFIDSNVGWWNVEHFDDAMPRKEREDTVREAFLFRESSMGPYAVHEGLPGHHLQLSIARLNPDPLRNLFADNVPVEGWALYAEREMWEQGGLGPSVAAHVNILKSWQFRIRRVIYDVNVETGVWNLQEAADWKDRAAPGAGTINPEIRRTINWPAQLISYFAGRKQIIALKEDFRRKLGDQYSERRFNDELLAVGSVPYVFARARMLGEPVPDF